MSLIDQLSASLISTTIAADDVLVVRDVSVGESNPRHRTKKMRFDQFALAVGAWMIRDTDGSHSMRLACGSNLTADRTVTIVPGDTDRSITLSGNPTLGDWFNQSVKTTAGPVFAGLIIDNNSTDLAGRFDGTVGTYSRWDIAGTPVGDVGSGNSITSGGSASNFGINVRGNNTILVCVNSTPVGRFTSTGLNSTAIGATTPGTGAFTTLSATGEISGNEFQLTGTGAFSPGSLYVNTTHGLVVGGKAGATNDFLLVNDDGSGVLANPTGTVDLVAAGNMKIAGLAGVGTRNVVADADGNLSAP
jgi:hypothetical protein